MLSVRIGLTRLARSVLVGSKRKMAASVTNLSDKRTVKGRTIRSATLLCRVYISIFHNQNSVARELAPSPQKPYVNAANYADAENDKGHPKVAFVGEASAKREAYLTAQPVSSDKALPMSASERTVFTPASSRAANFSSAVPLPPEMIAPAWPMRLPGGAVTPAM